MRRPLLVVYGLSLIADGLVLTLSLGLIIPSFHYRASMMLARANAR